MENKRDPHIPSAEAELVALGFTEIEALVYCDLLRRGAATGYRVSQRLGKAPANIYQSLASLAHKGALVSSADGEDRRTFRALPPAELIEMLRSNFQRRSGAALDRLAALGEAGNDERVYILTSVDQVMARARAMIARSTKIMLFDLFPEIHDLLADELAAARARGVIVAGIAYDPRHAGPMTPLNRESVELVSSRWPGLGIIMVVDGREQLVAQITKDRSAVLKAMWSDSAFLSCVFHSAIASDIRLVSLREDPSDSLRCLSLQGSAPPGLDRVLAGTAGGIAATDGD